MIKTLVISMITVLILLTGLVVFAEGSSESSTGVSNDYLSRCPIGWTEKRVRSGHYMVRICKPPYRGAEPTCDPGWYVYYPSETGSLFVHCRMTVYKKRHW